MQKKQLADAKTVLSAKEPLAYLEDIEENLDCHETHSFLADEGASSNKEKNPLLCNFFRLFPSCLQEEVTEDEEEAHDTRPTLVFCHDPH